MLPCCSGNGHCHPGVVSEGSSLILSTPGVIVCLHICYFAGRCHAATGDSAKAPGLFPLGQALGLLQLQRCGTLWWHITLGAWCRALSLLYCLCLCGGIIDCSAQAVSSAYRHWWHWPTGARPTGPGGPGPGRLCGLDAEQSASKDCNVYRLCRACCAVIVIARR
jgi:hypothetical protein